ncbi:sphingosine-1-phosphate phosphatase 2-like [Mizuhopecten yessoensis]|uniref:sphingosine-1-phosphate phosphatase 2-like n=1 Tax=Mizuhopecten yessoensis TaxID=6573 RepID=UPI000B45CAAC|nr:sphingosine-1-phosphate phosphatase 2-like [Mizuhopecten yessoensis]
MDLLKDLNNPELTAKFQRFCGVHYTRKESSRCGSNGEMTERSGGTFKPAELSTSTAEQTTPLKNNLACDGLQKRNKNQMLKNEDDWEKSNDPPATDISEYTIKYRLLLHFFTIASSLGNEAFYLLFYPCCYWNCDSLLIRQTALVWCLCMWVGQGTKDSLMLPRPSAPPVVRLETYYLQEYAMPSTHAMSATAIPVVLAYLIISRYQVSAPALIVAAVVWCSMVCLSRLYLGVHSVLDILAGVVFSLVVIVLTTPYVADFDWYQQTHPFAPLVIFISSLAMCTVFYPSSKTGDVYTYNTRGDAVQIVAVLAGVGLGAWTNLHLGFTNVDDNKTDLLYEVELPTLKIFAISVLRFFVGTVILFTMQYLLKSPLVRFFSYMLGLEKPEKKNPQVEVGYKFVMFYCLGMAISFFIPFVHCMFGLDRPAFYAEVV